MSGQELLEDTFPITLFLGIICLLCLYWYSTQNFDFWKKRGIPHDGPAIPFIGTLYPMLWKPLHEIDLERYQKLGPVFGQFDGNTPVLAVADPKIVREILVKEFPTFMTKRMSEFVSGDVFARLFLFTMRGGDEWKRIRSVMSPIFSTGKIKTSIHHMKECSSILIENLKKAAGNRKPLRVKQFTDAFSLDFIARTTFSIQLDSYKDPLNSFSQNCFKTSPPSTSYKVLFYQFWPKLARLIGVQIFNTKPLNYFKELAICFMDQRAKTGQTMSDILELLMGHVKEFSETEGNVGNNEKDKKSQNKQEKSNSLFKRSLSLEEAMCLNVQFFLGAFDTISSTVSNAVYFLAVHPDIQNRVYEEVRDVLQKTKGDLTYEALQEMNHLNNVISETLRLCPPFQRLERVTEADYKLGDTSVTIPKGTVVIVPIYAMHRDPKLYPDPERFDPDRFLPEERAKRDPYAYLAFGCGPRVCIAMRHGTVQIKTCLTYLLANFKFHRCPETKVPLEFRLGPGPLRCKPQILRFEERTDKILLK